MDQIKLKPEVDERFVYIASRHWVALLWRAALPALIGAGAAFLFVVRVLGREPDFLGREPPIFDLINAGLLLTLVVTAALVIYTWLDWRNDHLIVSNQRVVHEDRTLWLAYMYEIIPIDQVQNVNVMTENIFQYTLKYGRVEIHAAGPTSPIIFDRACRPAEIQQQVLGEVQRQKRTMEQKRLSATVARRLDPNAPPPDPLPLPDKLGPRQGPFYTLLPLGPMMQSGIITWHRHWVVLVKHMIWPVIAVVVWWLLLAAVLRFGWFEPAIAGIVLFLLFAAVAFFFYWQYEDWRNDIYILEPTRIVDVQRLPLGLFEHRREASLAVIQNVSASSPNIIARIFGYGNVLIETAGVGGNFTFDHVPNPDLVQRIVFEYREAFRWQQREREWNNMLNIVDMYHRTGHRGNSPPP